jgi:hypothetical protein
MRSVVCLLVLAFFCSGWALAAASLHVVYTPATFTLVTKEGLGLTDTWVDTRAWSLQDVSAHPVLLRRLVQVNRLDLLGHLADPASEQPLRVQLIEAMQQPYVDTPPPAQVSPASWRSYIDVNW